MKKEVFVVYASYGAHYVIWDAFNTYNAAVAEMKRIAKHNNMPSYVAREEVETNWFNSLYRQFGYHFSKRGPVRRHLHKRLRRLGLAA